jgi:predicted Zn-dependent protease
VAGDLPGAVFVWRGAEGAKGKAFAFMLAQIQMRQQKFDDARKMLDPLAKNAPDPQLCQRAHHRSIRSNPSLKVMKRRGND